MPETLTVEECRRLMRAATDAHVPRDAMILALFLHTGIRLEALGALDVEEVGLAGVGPWSPAEKARSKEGDVILEFNDEVLDDVQAHSRMPCSPKPGEEITVVCVRDGRRATIKADLGAKRREK